MKFPFIFVVLATFFHVSAEAQLRSPYRQRFQPQFYDANGRILRDADGTQPSGSGVTTRDLTDCHRQGSDASDCFQVHPRFDLRAGPAVFGRSDAGPNFGGEIGVRFVTHTGQFLFRGQMHIAVGETGMPYLALNTSLARIMWSLDSARFLWMGAGLLEFDALASTHPDLRGRFGWNPKILFGVSISDGRRDCPRGDRMCERNRRCNLSIFTTVGGMIGYQQNMADQAGTPSLGAEVFANCREFAIDASYTHLFAMHGPTGVEVDVDRMQADIFGAFNVEGFDLGPYLTGQLSYERGNPALAPTDPTVTPDPRYGDRMYYLVGGGVRVGFW